MNPRVSAARIYCGGQWPAMSCCIGRGATVIGPAISAPSALTVTLLTGPARFAKMSPWRGPTSSAIRNVGSGAATYAAMDLPTVLIGTAMST